MVAGITGPAIVSITTQICGDAVSLVSSENLNQNWSDGTLIELSKPRGRVNSEKIAMHFPSEKHSQCKIKIFPDLMFDIIMVLWEGIYFEMQRLLCRKVNLATGWYCGSSKNDKIFMQ